MSHFRSLESMQPFGKTAPYPNLKIWHASSTRVVRADLSFFVSVLQAQGIHGAHYCSQGLDGVAVNNRLVLLHIIAGETVLMDDPGHKERYRVKSADIYRETEFSSETGGQNMRCTGLMSSKETVKEQRFVTSGINCDQRMLTTKQKVEPALGSSITSRLM